MDEFLRQPAQRQALIAGVPEGRVQLDLDALRSFDGALADQLLQAPLEAVPQWEKSCLQAAQELSEPSITKTFNAIRANGEQPALKIGVSNVRAHRSPPSGLHAGLLTKLVCVEGIVTRTSVVEPRVLESVHYCEATDRFYRHVFRDNTALQGQITSAMYPSKDEDGNLLETEFGFSKFSDRQRVWVQDLPERMRAGDIPRSVQVILDDDLVSTCKAGDRVAIVGIYRALTGRTAKGAVSGVFRQVLLGLAVRPLAGAGAAVVSDSLAPDQLTESEIGAFRALSRRRDLMSVLGQSLAPNVFGHDMLKRALILALLGGVEHNLADGAHIRGDINVLMVGDPSTAKSQLLRAVMAAAPLSVSTTGRGSSGVGLTAAVLSDKDTGERRLEAGAMVLADRGVVCIDEFDKMSDSDRTAIHEVMEQQTVTIAKGGIHTSLNARCTVVAAANPIYSNYDASISVARNVALPDSLLSRFDLLFIVLDKNDSELDRAIASHVLAQHRRNNNSNSAEVARDAKNNKLGALLTDGDKEYLPLTALKKYIAFAKRQKNPILEKGAARRIGELFAQLRAGASDLNSLPITPRVLESLIRLASAHAKARLSKAVNQGDVDAAFALLQFALTNDTSGVVEAAATQPAASVQVEEHQDASGRDTSERPAKRAKQAGAPDTADETTAPSQPLSSTQLRKFVRALNEIFTELDANDTTIQHVVDQLEGQFTAVEARQGLEQLVARNRITIEDSRVYRV